MKADYNPIIPLEYVCMSEALQEAQEQLAHIYYNRAEGWCRDMAIECLPAHIVKDVDDNKHNCSQATRDYMNTNVLLKEYPDRIEFWFMNELKGTYTKPFNQTEQKDAAWNGEHKLNK